MNIDNFIRIFIEKVLICFVPSCSNVCYAEKCTKRNSNTVVHLVRFSA